MDRGAWLDLGSIPASKHFFIKTASIEFVIFSISAAIGVDCWFSMTPKLFSLPPSGCQFSGVKMSGWSLTILSTSSIIRDFEQEIKIPREVKLVIAWDEGSSNSNQFHFVDIEHGIHHLQDKVYPKVTRYLKDTRSGSEIQVLLLKSVVDRIREQEEE